MTMIWGIDPGSEGALAVMAFSDMASGVNVYRFKNSDFTKTLTAMRDLIDFEGLPDRVYLEKVHGMPNDGGANAFSFGLNTGWLKGVLDSLGIQYQEVSPQTWQCALGLGKKFDKKSERKKAHQTKAQQLFGWQFDRKITLDMADALLIAEYGRLQMRKGDVL